MLSTDPRKGTRRKVEAFDTDIELIRERAKALGVTAADVSHDICAQLRRRIYLEELGESFETASSNFERFQKLEQQTYFGTRHFKMAWKASDSRSCDDLVLDQVARCRLVLRDIINF